MRRQCELLGVVRATVDYQPVPEDPEDLLIKRLLDELYMRDPCLGVRRLVTVLERDYGLKVNRKRLKRLRDEMGQQTIYCRPRTSIPDDGHRKYPYLLRKLAISTATRASPPCGPHSPNGSPATTTGARTSILGTSPRPVSMPTPRCRGKRRRPPAKRPSIISS